MSQLVIVAIPREDDYVWKISSEKVPHLTLCNLGEMTPDKNVVAMAEYLEHVAATSLNRFGLSVDRRGTLGPNEADVLFFDHNYCYRTLEDLSTYLLGEPHIKDAYNSTPQYEEYIPHLTLGYPNSPAKPDNRDYPGITWVVFDRVALWTGNYEGPTFLLKDEMDDISMAGLGEEFLQHFGVKGMRWGVRKSSTEGGGSPNESQDHATAKASAKKARKHGSKALTNNELQALITRMNLEKQYASVAPTPRGIRLLRAGGKFTGDVLVNVGKQQATKLAADQATKLVGLVLKK